jgi:hypothetical protein
VVNSVDVSTDCAFCGLGLRIVCLCCVIEPRSDCACGSFGYSANYCPYKAIVKVVCETVLNCYGIVRPCTYAYQH